jgi:hypothetical protein
MESNMTKRLFAAFLVIASIVVFAGSANGTTDGITDATGDVAEPKADIVSASAAYTNGQIKLTTNVASPTNPSTDPNWNNNQSGVGWALDTNGDGTPDFGALYGKAGAGVFLPNQTLKCQATGSYSASQPNYTVTFPASCINSPSSFRWYAGTRYFNGAQVEDSAPDNQQVCCSVSNTNTSTTTPTTMPGSTTSTTAGPTTTTIPPSTTTTVPPVPGAQITTGAGQGGAPHVQKFDSNGTAGAPGFYAYDPSNTGGVPVARGDLTNDPGDEIVVGSGRGGAIGVFKADGSPIFSGTPFGAGFGGGIEVAVGDVTGDSANEIIVAAGAGGGPHVRVLNADGTPIGNGFFAYGVNFTGGVHVAVGRISGASKSQIVTGAGPGGAPHVRAFDADGVAVGPGFYAYGLNFTGGVYVAVADSDVITGAGPGAAPHVRSFDVNGTPKASFYAYPETFAGGVRVAAAQLGGASGREIITGAGPGGAPHVRVFTNAGVATPTSFYAYGESFRGGVFVSGSPR